MTLRLCHTLGVSCESNRPLLSPPLRSKTRLRRGQPTSRSRTTKIRSGASRSDVVGRAARQRIQKRRAVVRGGCQWSSYHRRKRASARAASSKHDMWRAVLNLPLSMRTIPSREAVLQQPAIGAVETLEALAKGATPASYCCFIGASTVLENEADSPSTVLANEADSRRPLSNLSEYAEGAENEIFREKIARLASTYSSMRRRASSRESVSRRDSVGSLAVFLMVLRPFLEPQDAGRRELLLPFRPFLLHGAVPASPGGG